MCLLKSNGFKLDPFIFFHDTVKEKKKCRECPLIFSHFTKNSLCQRHTQSGIGRVKGVARLQSWLWKILLWKIHCD